MITLISDLFCAAVSGLSLFLSLLICLDESYMQNMSMRFTSWRSRKFAMVAVGVLALSSLSVLFRFSLYLCVFCSFAALGSIIYMVNYPAYLHILKRKVFLPDTYNFVVTLIFTLALFSVLSMSSAVVSFIPNPFLKLSLLSVMFISEYAVAGVMLICGDCLFLFPKRRRRKMEESLLANSDPKYACGTSFSSGSEAIMKRLKSYLENEKAYLNPDLMASDVARIIFTNRSYLAKTIKIHTQGNFCQMVNKYRVEYSIELFNKDPHLTVAELASMSGFKTTPTYSAAFRMLMDESPIEWCKYRRACLTK